MTSPIPAGGQNQYDTAGKRCERYTDIAIAPRAKPDPFCGRPLNGALIQSFGWFPSNTRFRLLKGVVGRDRPSSHARRLRFTGPPLALALGGRTTGHPNAGKRMGTIRQWTENPMECLEAKLTQVMQKTTRAMRRQMRCAVNETTLKVEVDMQAEIDHRSSNQYPRHGQVCTCDAAR